jgi:tol-pal system protein YbgF
MMRQTSDTSLLRPLAVAVFCLGWSALLAAQEYIDVEAERSRGRVVADPLPQSTPGTARSFPAPGSSPGSAVSVPDFPTAVAGPSTVNPDTSRLVLQLQQLQEEVMDLRGRVEEQAFEIQQLKQQSLERYVDLDRRISSGAGADMAPAPAPSAARPEAPVPAASAAPPAASASQPADARADANEAEAYRAAYSLVRNQDFPEAIAAFKRFLEVYPDGGFTPNAHYWLGELYLVLSPPDTVSAQRAFSELLQRYPRDPKVPDALYKLGKVSFDNGDRVAARGYLERVVNEFADSNSSAITLSRDFLRDNF